MYTYREDAMNRKVTTDEAAPRKFAPHGRVEYQALDGGVYYMLNVRGHSTANLSKRLEKFRTGLNS